jgi:predicted ATP-dependent endonuclease of OLD family
MELTKFRVQNYRSVNDSGDIEVEQVTDLVGRNESGKSALLLALASLNPPGGREALAKIKDFPRGRRLGECTDDTPVVTTLWKLTTEEITQLSDTLGFVIQITSVEIIRTFGASCRVRFIGLEASTPNQAESTDLGQRLRSSLTARMNKLEDAPKTNLEATLRRLDGTNDLIGDAKAWATEITSASAELRSQLSEALDEASSEPLKKLEDKAKLISSFDAAHAAARDQALSWLPIFVYVSDFPELHGYQNLDDFTQRRGQNLATKEREDNFARLAKVADFDPAYLNANRDDHETRNQILNRAGAVVTAEIRRLWKDRQLTVRFNLDGLHLDVLVADPNALYSVEINLDERSRGFRWFFAFYIIFAADTRGGNAERAILLLDEPGLHLHAKSQGDLLKHFREDFKTNQIIYTTHSPFMVPPDAINIVRTVNIDQERGTTVTNSPTGDSKTLFPLQAALGYHISQTLFIGHSNLIVEGVTDFWILSAVNNHFRANGRPALPDELTVTPVGGTGKVSYMAALLTSEELNVLVLLDDETAGRIAHRELVTSKLVRDSAIMFVTEGFPNPKPVEADIEDLLDPQVYDALAACRTQVSVFVRADNSITRGDDRRIHGGCS